MKILKSRTFLYIILFIAVLVLIKIFFLQNDVPSSGPGGGAQKGGSAPPMKVNGVIAEGVLLEEKVDHNTKRIDELFDKFNPKEITKDSIFFKGDIYDAYSVLLEIFNLAKDEIIIIDNYVGKVLLDELRSIDKDIIIISSNLNANLRKKYLKQYNNIKFIKNDSYHDRFIIIDRKRVFHSGASFKDLGRKCFGIHEIENSVKIEKLINEVFNTKPS